MGLGLCGRAGDVGNAFVGGPLGGAAVLLLAGYTQGWIYSLGKLFNETQNYTILRINAPSPPSHIIEFVRRRKDNILPFSVHIMGWCTHTVKYNEL